MGEIDVPGMLASRDALLTSAAERARAYLAAIDRATSAADCQSRRGAGAVRRPAARTRSRPGVHARAPRRRRITCDRGDEWTSLLRLRQRRRPADCRRYLLDPRGLGSERRAANHVAGCRSTRGGRTPLVDGAVRVAGRHHGRLRHGCDDGERDLSRGRPRRRPFRRRMGRGGTRPRRRALRSRSS